MGNKHSRKAAKGAKLASSGKSSQPAGDERGDSISVIPDDHELGARLKEVPLFSKLTNAERAKLGGALVRKEYADSVEIVTQGDVGDEFYAILEGKASIFVNSGSSREKVADLEQGDYFGEAALINKETRNATVVANGPVVCLALNQETFNTLFGKKRLNVNFAKRQAISAEKLREAAAGAGAPADAVRDKDSATQKLIADAVQKNVLFSTLDPDQIGEIVMNMFKKSVKSGETIIEQGADGDNFYVVESGSFDVFVKKVDDENPKKVAERKAGSSFGELALMYNSPRAATVTATSDSVCWAIDRYSFKRILIKTSSSKLSEYEEFLKGVDVLSSLLSAERRQVAEALDGQGFSDGDVICRQGEPGDKFYIIRRGNASVLKRDAPDAEEKKVNTLGKGDYFGERALLKQEARAATVIADGTLECLVMERSDFALLLGPLSSLMEDRITTEYTESPKGDQKDTAFIDLTWEDLKVLGTLGKGSFGTVVLVQNKKDSDTYARKAISKAQIVQLGQQEHVMSEKNVMARLNSQYLIKLYQTFKDDQNLYFILELCLGGELFTVLRNRTVFNEDTSRFYAACVVSGFSYMHDRNIIYRDLKPENLLLDSDGYLKITDFGFAKVVKDRTWTLCGTPDYLAPEVVSGQGHGKGVDWWTLGILIYEMLASYPPFYDEDPMKTYAKIMQGRVLYPKHFTRNAVDLISKLLHPKPTKRIGVLKGGASLIMKHPWFKGFDWDALHARKLKAPIVPEVKSNTDVTNFEQYPDDGESYGKYHDDGTGWDADF